MRGVVFGPVGGRFTHTLRALRNTRRTRNILDEGSDVRLALVTSMEHKLILERHCAADADAVDAAVVTANATRDQLGEACRLYSNGTLLNDVVESWPDPPYTDESHNRGPGQGSSQWQMTSLGGPFRAPYVRTLFLDSDSYACPGFEKLFDALAPYSNRRCTSPSYAPANLAIGLEQFPSGSHGKKSAWRGRMIPARYDNGGGGGGSGGDANGSTTPLHHADFDYFAMRNTGVHIWDFGINDHTHVFAHFLVLVAEHLYNNVATVEDGVTNDQDSFRLALYIYRILVPEFHEVNFPQHASCRTYPNSTFAGIDGSRNGMYPVQRDGTMCSDCRCTPCLIAHNAGVLFVTVNGKKGWEDDEKISGGGNSLG
jgi:hypothetical protein